MIHPPCLYACFRFEQAPGLVVGSCCLRHPGPLLVNLSLLVLDIDVHEFASRNGMLYDPVVFPGPFPRVLDHVLRQESRLMFLHACTLVTVGHLNMTISHFHQLGLERRPRNISL